MEFLVLGGMILIMDMLRNVEVLKPSLKSLEGLKVPFGIVIILVGISSFTRPALIFEGIMGIIAGAILIIDVIMLGIKDAATRKKVQTGMLSLSIPVGILTIIAGIIGMFFK
ncbi:MAG TPA: hypothetical protein ENL19_01880 [candidate division WOR-3 bacterium]|uniref:Uncharacterized protein n=1 Tax=candidate division WOR-3 bacterium TaxID=2052148 RepID=A0A7C5HNI6_UNCW3|nr:hypothetical protein [candidate division WOR-3 bacterium]